MSKRSKTAQRRAAARQCAADRKTAANQANAQKSTGPRTPEGKAASSRNALKHGLTSKELAIHSADQPEFDSLQSALHHDFNPATPAETLLFQQILAAAWRLLRCDRVEAELMARTTEIDPLLDPALQPTLRTLSTVRSQALKQQRSATAELRTLQTERFYRGELFPENEPSEFGMANLMKAMPAVSKQSWEDVKNAVNAPPPGGYPRYDDLEEEEEEEPTERDPEIAAAWEAHLNSLDPKVAASIRGSQTRAQKTNPNGSL